MYEATSLLVANGNSGAMVLLPGRDLIVKTLVLNHVSPLAAF